MRRRYFSQPWIAFATVLLLAGFSAAKAQEKTPATPALPEMITKANALIDLSSAVPYELHARIAVNPGSKDAQRGEITIYRDQVRSRMELQLGDFHQVEVVSEDTRYVSRSRPYPLAGLDVLNNVKDALHLRNQFPAGTKFSTTYSRKVSGVPASCIDAKLYYAGKIRFCFDARTGAVLEASTIEGLRARFSAYAAAGEKSFPTQIELTLPGKPRHVELSEIQVTSRRFDDASFAVPASARAFRLCNGVARILVPALGPDWTFSDTEMGDVYLYAIAEADGSVHDLTVYGGKNKWMEKEVSKLTRKWKLLTAQCGARSIAAEVVLPVVRVVPELDSRTDSSSYSSYSSTTSNSFDIFRPYTYTSDSTDTTSYINRPPN